MFKDPKLKKKTRRGYRGKRYRDITSRSQAENKQETVPTRVTDEMSVVQDNELTKLGVLLAAKVETFNNFKPKLKYARSPKRIVASEIDRRATSSSSESDMDAAQDARYSAEFTNTSQFSSSCTSEASSTRHNGTMQNESKSAEKSRKDRRSIVTTLIKTDSSEANVCKTNMRDTMHKNSTKNTLYKSQKTIVNCKPKLQCKVQRKLKTAEFLYLSQLLERNSITNQTNNTRDTLMKKNKKDKIEIYTKKTANESIKKNMLKEYNCSNKDIIKNNVKTKNQQKTKQLSEIKKNTFSNYIPVQEMKHILKNQTSDNIQYVKGTLRVNPKYNNYAYLSMENKERDLSINGIIDRNRAFDGDLVVARINPKENWHTLANGEVQKTGTIVCILEEIHTRKVTGYLIQHVKKGKPFVIIKPRDQRVPLIKISSKSLPPLYHSKPNNYENALCFVHIYSWMQPNYALGKFLWSVGKAGDIQAELQAIILDNNLDVLPYQQELLRELPDNDVLTDIDIKDREDWRHECIFTIDPATAVDLDDAVSCKILNNGNYEIGVHISDVTHYLKFFSSLDYEIAKRATTVYLPHTSYHMLPEQLCRVCSLLPGKDRLTFSVIWEMTPNAEIIKQRFAKTIVKSCCRMSYESAQVMIDNPKITSSKDILDIKGDYTVASLSDIVNNLFKLSVILRNKRYTNGALRLDQPRIEICMDPSIIQGECGIPIPVNYQLKEYKDSNRLIEEFMLLANMTVATQLYNAIPETALLRAHREPVKYSLETTCEILRNYGIHLNIETAGDLHTSIQRYEQNLECNINNTVNNSMKYIMMVITNVCSKAMTRAEYKCASAVFSPCDLKHYALNTPLYTHFTSPIRRYSDCIVHRLLYATIENKPLPKEWTASLCSKIANNCNIKKNSAKLVQEQSTELFFTHMVGLSGGFDALAIVLDVKERGMDVILCDTGIKSRVNFKDIKSTTATVEYSARFSVPTVTINWKTPPIAQIINMFSLVHVRVEKINEEFRLKVLLKQ